jgi:CRISPR/Cas system-associated exonuclease Cas4 (RecB family)
MNQKITAWSYSRWTTYEECPYRAKMKFIARHQEPSNPAAERGTAIHKLAEEYLNGERRTVPAELKTLQREFRDARKVDGIRTEAEMAYTAEWNVTGWFDRDAWCRIKIDLLVPPKTGVTRVVDLKTGRFKPGTYTPQLELYAIAALIAYPEHEVRAELWFSDHGIVHYGEPALTYSPDDLPRLKKLWEKRTKAMLSDTKFAPRPGGYCRWCSFSKAKGGSCKF